MSRKKELTSVLPFILLYVIIVYWLFPYIGYYADNYDVVAYLDVADNVAKGHLSDSVNGYWSPLISWILSLLIYLGWDPLLSFRIIQFLIAVLSLLFFNRLQATFNLQKLLRVVLLLSATLILSGLSYQLLSADLLFVCLALFYLQLLLRTNIFSENNYGWAWGLAGGLLFLSKSFGLPFFVIHLTASVIWLHTREPLATIRKQLWKQFTIAILLFTVIAGSWVIVLSNRYGEFTISKAAGFNASIEVSPMPGITTELPVLNGQVFHISNEHSCAWTEPGNYVTITPLQPAKSKQDFTRSKLAIDRNMLSIYFNDFKRQAGTLFLIMMTFFLITMRKRHVAQESNIVLLLLAYVFLYAGYTLILVHDRYLWLNIFLSLLLASIFVKELWVNKKIAGYISFCLFTVFILLLLKKNYKQLVYSMDKPIAIEQLLTDARHLPATLKSNYQKNNQQIFAIKNAASLFQLQNKKILCIDVPLSYPYYYSQSALLAFYTQSRYEGMYAAVKENYFKLDDRGNADLSDYYFVSWDKTLSKNHRTTNVALLQKNLFLFYADPLSGMKIYVTEKKM